VRCLEIERELEWRDEDEDDNPRARALAFVRSRLLEQPDLQLDELRVLMRSEQGMRVSRASMYHMRSGAGVPLAKRRPSDDDPQPERSDQPYAMYSIDIPPPRCER
jgi:transposase